MKKTKGVRGDYQIPDFSTEVMVPLGEARTTRGGAGGGGEMVSGSERADAGVTLG